MCEETRNRNILRNELFLKSLQLNVDPTENILSKKVIKKSIQQTLGFPTFLEEVQQISSSTEKLFIHRSQEIEKIMKHMNNVEYCLCYLFTYKIN
jgi:hypothetical protein